MKVKKIKRRHSVESLCQFFWRVERQYDLFNLRICGVYIWQYIRMPIYYRLAEAIGVLEKPHKIESSNKIIKFRERFKFLIHSFLSLKDLYFLKNNYSIAVLEHDRSVNIDGKYRDVYTYLYRKKIIEESSVLSLRLPFGTNYIKDDDLNDSIDLSWLLLMGGVISSILPASISKQERLIISQLENEMKSFLSVDFNLVDYMSKYIRRYNFRSKIIRLLLRKIGAKHLDIVTPYSGRGDFVGAARQEGLTTRELQHGIISYYHLGYSFPRNTTLPADHIFTDELATWGKDWDLGAIHHNYLSISSTVVDYPLKEKLEKYDIKEKPESKNITVISQGALTDSIAEVIIKNIEKFYKYKIIYKLHPSEYNLVNDRLKVLEGYENVEIVKGVDLLEVLYSSKYVVGVFSTALIEAKLLGCEVVILPLSGSEYFESSRGYIEFKEFLNELF